MATLAVYTTVYPGVERYLADWFASVRLQTDQDYQVWIGLDTLDVESVKAAMGGDPEAVWIHSRDGDTPGSLRQRALAEVVDNYDGVVLVDSDDILHSTRVATAREMLSACDLAGCALRIVDEQGSSVGATFALPPGVTPDAVFPRTNVFGLSNSAFRSDLLRRCLPIPDGAMLVDWFLSTRAWLLGARLCFATRVEMDYRQHATNTARVCAPFSACQVREDTERVRAHFGLVRASDLDDVVPLRRAALDLTAAEVEDFHQRIVMQPAALAGYVAALNERGSAMLWWDWVAHAQLRHLWTTEEGTV